MTTFINITTNSAVAQERYWSFHRPVIELSGHMNFTSPFESSDSCNTCNGACCDYCEKVITAGHFEFSVNSDELFQWMLEANVPENVAIEIAFGGRGHSYDGYYLEWPTEETLSEEFPEFYNTLTSPDGEVMDVIESFRGQFDTFHALREAVFAHFGLGKYCLSGHVYNQMEMYWYSCDYDHKKACTFSDDHNVDTELTADAELTVYKEEEKTMKNTINTINEIRRTLSPKGYNHACEDFAVFTYAPGDVFAICVEARTCTSCWQVGHDEEHVYAEVGERIKVSSLLSDPDLDPLYSEEDVEYFLSIDPNWDESLPVPTVATTVAELTVPEEVNEMNNHLGEVEFDPREESVVEREYLDAKERLERRGINPDEVKYFTHSTEPTGLGPIYRFVVRSFMSPARLRGENKKLLSALVEQKKDLSDFRDADIVETFETYNFDTAIDIMDTLTDLGYFKVYDLFREDDFEEEGGR